MGVYMYKTFMERYIKLQGKELIGWGGWLGKCHFLFSTFRYCLNFKNECVFFYN